MPNFKRRMVSHFSVIMGSSVHYLEKSFGAKVSLWRSRENEGWRIDLGELRSLIRPNTKYIIIK
jgi:aspartate/methionine/tyrosine aminotransferase